VGNLPYNISTPLLFHLLEHAASIEDLHIMLQKEVIARMAAQPNEDDYGRLTVMLAPWVTVERLFDVGTRSIQAAAASVVGRGATHRQTRAGLFAVSPHFAKVVAEAFSHRRKTLRNALRNQVSLEQIESCGLDPGARPETFSPQAFNDLATALHARR
jgi:16S rRNA (adenine1518-N6/adenine1519-N6)-dimethyltransferase